MMMMMMSRKMGFKKVIACFLIFTLILQLAVPLGAMAASDHGLNIKKAGNDSGGKQDHSFSQRGKDYQNHQQESKNCGGKA